MQWQTLWGIEKGDEYRYIRGFLFGKEVQHVPRHYSKIGENLYVDRHLRISISSDQKVVVLGFCVHCETWELSCEEIADLLSYHLARSEASLFAAEEKLCGNYVVFYQNGDQNWRIFSDAGGLKKLFVSRKGGIVGSHAKLVEEAYLGRSVPTIRLGGEPGSSVTQAVYGYSGCVEKERFPGIYTPYKDVLLVPTNHYVCSEDSKFIRFFPAKPYRPMTLKEAAPLFEEALANTIRGLFHNANKRVLVTCTAGIDSRFTLNTLMHISDNYELIVSQRHPGDPPTQDCMACITIAKNLNIPCHYIRPASGVDYRNNREFVAFSNALDCNNYYNFSKFSNTIQYLINKKFGVDECIGVHSNMMELGKGWMGRTMYKEGRDEFPHNTTYARAFQLDGPTLLGYPTDKLFYLEQQICAFRGHHIQHVEASYEFFNPYVCRYIFDLYHRTPHFVWKEHQIGVINRNSALSLQ